MTVVFLDRDGVINENRDEYVRTADDMVFVPGALEGLARLKEAGITTVVVSNQAGVGRKLIDPAELERMNRKMLDAAREAGGDISAAYYCTHRKDEGCDCRKPGTGLLRRAAEDLGFEPAGCYLVGDSSGDIEAGYKAGCRTVLVLTGLSSATDCATWKYKPDHVSTDLPAAADWILTDRQTG